MAAIDITRIFERLRVVRLYLERAPKLGQCLFVLPIAVVIKKAVRDVRLRQIWRQSQRMLDRFLNFRELRFSERFHEPVLTKTRPGKASHRERKIRIARNGSLIPRDSLVE